ncbi:hypothetical protein ACOMHN_023250 [Nucella lapillus]
MASPGNSSDSIDEYFDQLMADRGDSDDYDDAVLGGDQQSDVSVSSVHTSDLSDFDISDISTSSDNDAVQADDDWTDDISQHRKNDFTQPIGPTRPLPLTAKPVDYFLQLFPLAMFQLLVEQTNLYAQQQGAQNFISVTEDKIKAYLGMLFIMGLVVLPSYTDYWCKLAEFRQDSIAKVMSVNRYQQITRYFHVNDSTTNPPRGHPDHDKLHKVRPIVENAKQQFSKHYKPHQNIAVDEAMVKFTGRCSFLQYVPAKPCKWGIKVWALADCESFYLVDFDIYTGKECVAAPTVPLGTRVVRKLVSPYFKKYHHVYLDNYFTSVDLMEVLLRKKTYACGTVRLNRRGLPDRLKHTKLTVPGQMLKLQKGRLLAVTWYDRKRQVSVLSTGNSIDNIQINRRGRRGLPDMMYDKPKAIQEYSENYNAVDKNDQLRSYYGIANKANKWWKYLFWFFCDVSMINAYILHREAPGGPRPESLSHKEFQLQVAKGLINGFSSRKRSIPVNVEGPDIKRPTRHQPTKIQTKRGLRNCVVCAKGTARTPAGNKIQTSWECKPCGVALCKDNGCFGRFHNYEQ